MEWIYPIRLDRYGLALEGESLELLRTKTGFDIEEQDRDDLAWSALRGALKKLPPADWERIVETLDHETLLFFRELLREHEEDAVRVAGSHKYTLVRGGAFLRHLAHPQARWQATNITGAMHLYALRQQWGTSYPTKPPIPYYKLAKAWGTTDKTVKEWDRRIAAAGPPPGETGDGFEYFSRIVKPPYKREGGST